MDMQGYREEVKLALSGGLLELEIEDAVIDKLVNSALRELQRYIRTPKLITIPFKSCIDMKDYKVNTVLSVHRTEGNLQNASSEVSSGIDPMYAAQWQLLSPTGSVWGLSNFSYNFASYSTMQQVRNTVSTDLAFFFNKNAEQLYINSSGNFPSRITVEYVPRYDDVSEIESNYWIDQLMKLSIAKGKIALGRIRTRFNQSNSLWTQDGERMIEEGNTELNELRASLIANSNLFRPID